MDTRNHLLAERLVNYSCELKKGERVWIEQTGAYGHDLVLQLVEEVFKAGGVPFVNITDEQIQRAFLINADKEAIKRLAKYDSAKMKDMQAYIGIRSPYNAAELIDVPVEKKDLYQIYYNKPVNHDIRVKRTKWVVLAYPSPPMAQQSGMSTREYTDMYYSVCNMDYAQMSAAMDPLAELMAKTDKVHIVSPRTDISFSIKGMPNEKCDGKRNIPDGEIFTAPIKNSVNGKITFNTPSVYQGFCFENVTFTVKNGKIINASANDTARLNRILDTDPGSRFFGEFSLGLNTRITRPTKSILFDEKICGSLHLTPGSCYDEASNSNRSAIHWDLVLIQTPEYGGGEIYFDDVLIRKDGMFTLDKLQALDKIT